MKAIKDNATYLEKIVTQDDGDSDFAKVTDTVVNYIPNEIPLLDTTTNTQLKSEEELVENDEVLLIDTDNNITETQLGSVTTETTDTTQTLDVFGDNSCIATYTFDNETANDLSGNYNGVWSETEAYDVGKYGKAVNMINAPASTYIKTPIIDRQGSKEITISGWIKVPNNTGNWVSIWHLTPDDENLNGNSRQPALWLLGTDNTKFHIKNDGMNTKNLGLDSSKGSITYNEWHFITQLVTLRQMKFYIDGTLTDTYNSNEDFKFNNGYFYIGDKWYSKNHLIDQVRIFNRALTEDEVKQLYNEQKTKYIADISSANLSEAPTKAFKKQLPSISIAIEATEADITDTSFNGLTLKTMTYDGSKFTTVYSDLEKEGRVIQRKIVAPNKGIQVVEPFTSNLWKKG